MQEVNTSGVQMRILLKIPREEGMDQECLKKSGGGRWGIWTGGHKARVYWCKIELIKC